MLDQHLLLDVSFQQHFQDRIEGYNALFRFVQRLHSAVPSVVLEALAIPEPAWSARSSNSGVESLSTRRRTFARTPETATSCS